MSDGETFGVVFLALIVVGVAIYINYLVAKLFEKLAADKGYTDGAYAFRMCFWLGMIGYVYVAAMPTKTCTGKKDAAPKVEAPAEAPAEEPAEAPAEEPAEAPAEEPAEAPAEEN